MLYVIEFISMPYENQHQTCHIKKIDWGQIRFREYWIMLLQPKYVHSIILDKALYWTKLKFMQHIYLEDMVCLLWNLKKFPMYMYFRAFYTIHSYYIFILSIHKVHFYLQCIVNGFYCRTNWPNSENLIHWNHSGTFNLPPVYFLYFSCRTLIVDKAESKQPWIKASLVQLSICKTVTDLNPSVENSKITCIKK